MTNVTAKIAKSSILYFKNVINKVKLCKLAFHVYSVNPNPAKLSGSAINYTT